MADGTVGNHPTAGNPAGQFAATAPVSPSPFTAGPEGNYPTGSMADTYMEAAAQVVAAAQANAESQAQARQFIMANGAEVVGGHKPVNPAPGQIAGNTAGDIADAG